MKNFREILGLGVIAISVIILGVVGYKIVGNAKATTEDYQFVYSSILPLVGTWVGVVLAFYFGKENYEAASKRYENILNKLTPDVLDNVAVSQIMISKKTMVSRKWSELKDLTVKDVIDFLASINKSRLPILDDQGKVKYIIHESLLSKPQKKEGVGVQAADTSVKMSAFATANESIIGQIITAKETETLEKVRQLMSNTANCKDVFVESAGGELVGWLTDTLILRYINEKEQA